MYSIEPQKDISIAEVPTSQLYRELKTRLSSANEVRRIRYPADVLPHLQHFANRLQEHFLVIALDGAHCIIDEPICVTVGLSNRTLIHPREVFRPAIEKNATAVICAHNHPSGSTDPSAEDHDVTVRLVSAGEVLGIRLLDHVIFSSKSYYSFLEEGKL